MGLRFFQLLVLIALCSTAFGAFACGSIANNSSRLLGNTDPNDWDACIADAAQLSQVLSNTNFVCGAGALYILNCADAAERLQLAVGNGVNFFCGGNNIVLQYCDSYVMYLNNVLNSLTASPTTSAPITSAPTGSPPTASPTTSFPTDVPTQSPSSSSPTKSPTTVSPTKLPTKLPSSSPTMSTVQLTVPSTTSPNRSQTTAQSTIPSIIQPTSSVAPPSPESDQQKTTPSDDGIDVQTIVIIVIVLLVIISVAVIIWRQRSGHSPSKTNHQQSPVTENATFTSESTAPNNFEAAATLNPMYDRTAPEIYYSEISTKADSIDNEFPHHTSYQNAAISNPEYLRPVPIGSADYMLPSGVDIVDSDAPSSPAYMTASSNNIPDGNTYAEYGTSA